MSWRLGAIGLAACVAGMAIGAAPPDSGVALRGLFVVSALGGSWIVWRLAPLGDLTLRHVVVLAILLRGLVFPLLPSLSDDGYRYIWDGRLTAHGVSPYAALPSDDRFAAWHDSVLYQEMNSPDYYSVYPPASQLLFSIGGWLYPLGWEVSWYAVKLALVALEGVGIACLARVVDRRGLALYALHPLPIIEIAGQGHTEGALIAGLGVALWGASRHPAILGAALSVAGWTKLYPFGLALALQRRWVGWAVFGGVTLIGAAALVPASGVSHVLDSVRLYGGTLDFYSAPFLALKAALYPVLGEGAGSLSSTLLFLGWCGFMGALTVSLDGTPTAVRRYLALGVIGYALASPMQHPWNWIGAVYMMPLLQTKKWLWWLIAWSSASYLRYVDLDHAYAAVLAIGWGGAAWIYASSRRGLQHVQD